MITRRDLFDHDHARRMVSTITQAPAGSTMLIVRGLALMPGPELLILDEPTRPYPGAGGVLRATAGNTGTVGSVLLSYQVLGEVQRVPDRIVILRAGWLIAVKRNGPPAHEIAAPWHRPVRRRGHSGPGAAGRPSGSTTEPLSPDQVVVPHDHFRADEAMTPTLTPILISLTGGA